MLIKKSTLNNTQWQVTSDPAIEPVSKDELKLFARIDGDEEDSMLDIIIGAVRQSMQFYLNRSLIEQEITFTMDRWDKREVELPVAPLLSVTGIYTTNEEDTDTEYSSDYYYVVTESIPGKIVIKNDHSLPENTDRFTAGYKIKYKAGYGSQMSDVPDAIRLGILNWATVAYETRAVSTEPPEEIKAQLGLYRVNNA